MGKYKKYIPHFVLKSAILWLSVSSIKKLIEKVIIINYHIIKKFRIFFKYGYAAIKKIDYKIS